MWCWRRRGGVLTPLEALVGVIMVGLSTGYFFVVVSRIHQWRPLEYAADSHHRKTPTLGV